MKKTLLSVTAALAVIGSAYAVPAGEIRKALCEKHPEKYVWVEKDEFCAPINPCESNNESIKKGYCIDDIVTTGSLDQQLVIQEKYVENILHTSILQSLGLINAGTSVYFPYKLNDGRYVVFIGKNEGNPTGANLMGLACQVYGGDYDYSFPIYEDGQYICSGIITAELCEQLGAFSERLVHGRCKVDFDDQECVIYTDTRTLTDAQYFKIY